MKTTRREFMQALGVMLASLVTSRCRPQVTCYTQVAPTATPRPIEGDDSWNDLRQPWLDLELLARDAQDPDQGEVTRERLVNAHRAALDTLIEVGELDPAVADDLQIAFESAAAHVWRANAPITCYIAAPGPDYAVASSSDLARQADLLADLAGSGEIDEETIAQAQAAIARDMAYLVMPDDERRALIEAVQQAAGDGGLYPSLAELDMDIPWEAVEAARFLVALLVGVESDAP